MVTPPCPSSKLYGFRLDTYPEHEDLNEDLDNGGSPPPNQLHNIPAIHQLSKTGKI